MVGNLRVPWTKLWGLAFVIDTIDYMTEKNYEMQWNLT